MFGLGVWEMVILGGLCVAGLLALATIGAVVYFAARAGRASK
ncbi:MAG TPA: hypothetical protein PLI18_04555 [Pirellulaceae bacterium]|nr:hypothetical protein [Pirellulaceae bacterium]